MLPKIFKTRGSVHRLDRRDKARMIEAFLVDGLKCEVAGLRVLDIGCGNGMISEFFAEKNQVTGVDVQDLRNDKNGSFEHVLVDSATLPLPDGEFDVVISHHVIEHIPDQTQHLSEIHRVLKPDGVLYLGTPNKSSPIMEGHVGNDMVLRHHEMAPLFQANGFVAESLSLRLVSKPDEYFGDVRFGRFFPQPALRLLMRWFPSHYFLLRKNR